MIDVDNFKVDRLTLELRDIFDKINDCYYDQLPMSLEKYMNTAKELFNDLLKEIEGNL